MAADTFAKIDGATGNIVYSNNGNGIESSARLGVGHYQVKWSNPGFPPNGSLPVVVATVMNDPPNVGCDKDGANCSISVTEVTTEHVCFGIRAASDCHTSVDCSFNFYAVGPTRTR